MTQPSENPVSPPPNERRSLSKAACAQNCVATAARRFAGGVRREAPVMAAAAWRALSPSARSAMAPFRRLARALLGNEQTNQGWGVRTGNRAAGYWLAGFCAWWGLIGSLAQRHDWSAGAKLDLAWIGWTVAVLWTAAWGRFAEAWAGDDARRRRRRIRRWKAHKKSKKKRP